MDIMAILSLHFPGVRASAKGFPVTYENITWEGGDPMPTAAQLDQVHVDYHKTIKIKELSDVCASKIVGGFDSSALGAPHRYDSQAVDQLNLVGSWLVTTPDDENPNGSTTLHAARPYVNGELQLKEYLVHNQSQMKRVILDGVAFKLVLLQRFNELRNYILANELTAEQVDAVTWDTVIPA